jgi:hypothetical protein
MAEEDFLQNPFARDVLSTESPPIPEAPPPEQAPAEPPRSGYQYLDTKTDNPDNSMKVSGLAYTFGGQADYESGQDNGRFAGGGYSYDPQTGWNNPEPYIALPGHLRDLVPKGQVLRIINNQTGQTALGINRDEGPRDDLVEKGRFDVSPTLLHELGAQNGDPISIDFSGVNKLPVLPVREVGDNDSLANFAMRNLPRDQVDHFIQSQPRESLIAGPPTAASLQQTRPVDQNFVRTGDIDTYPDGTTVNRRTQTVFTPIPGSTQMEMWHPGMKQSRLVNVAPKTLKDSNTGEIYVISPTRKHPEASPENPIPVNLPSNADINKVDMSTIKPGDYDSVPEEYRDTVRMIAEYKYPKVTGRIAQSPYMRKIIDIAAKVNPDFDFQNYDKLQKMNTDFAGEGKNGQTLLSFNTAMRHANDVRIASDALKKEHDGSQLDNWIYFKSKTLGGATELPAYQRAAGNFAEEAERAFTGAAPTVSGIEHRKQGYEGGMATIPTASQRTATLNTDLRQLAGRYGEVQNQWDKQHGSNTTFMSPDAEKSLLASGDKELIEFAHKYGSITGKRHYIDPSSLGSTAKQAEAEKETAPTGSSDLPANTLRTMTKDGETYVEMEGQWVPLQSVIKR